MSEHLVSHLIGSSKVWFQPGLFWIAKRVFQANGYEWEIRRNGELKLGFWRKSLRKKDPRRPYPKRLLLVPGFGDSPLSWYGVTSLLMPVLKTKFDEIILFDFPGHGGFLYQEKSFPSLDLMKDMVNDVLDSLKPHTVLGHSLGGWLAAQYASLCGAGIRPIANKLNYSGPDSILLFNPSGIFCSDEMRKECELVFKNSIQSGFSILRSKLFAKEPLWFRWFESSFAEFISREDIIQFIESSRPDHVLDRLADQIKSEVWIFWGEKDALIPASCAQAWLKFLNRNLREKHHVIYLKGAGHSPQVEKPGVTAALLGQILSKKKVPQTGKRWWQELQEKCG